MNLREGFRRIGLVLGIIGCATGAVAAYVIIDPLWPVWREHSKFERLLNVATVKRASGPQWLADHTSHDKVANPCDSAAPAKPSSQSFTRPPLTLHEGHAHVPSDNKPDWFSQNAPKSPDYDALAKQAGAVDQHLSRWDEFDKEERAKEERSCWKANASAKGREEWTSQHDIDTGHTVAGDWWIDAFAPDPNPDGIKTIRYWEYDPGRVRSVELTNGDWSAEPPSPPELNAILLPLLYPVIGFLVPWGATKIIIWVASGFTASKPT
jgi:hypothetical protein